VQELVQHAAQDIPAGWDPSGRNFLFISDRTGSNGLWTISYEDGKVSGTPTLLRDALGGTTPHRVTQKGSFYYSVTSGLQDVFMAEIDVDNARVVSQPKAIAKRFIGSNRSPCFSPDGKTLTYIARRGIADRVIIFHDLESGAEGEVHPAVLNFGHPRWSPDGRSLTFIGSTTNAAGLFRMDPLSGGVTLLLDGNLFASYFYHVDSWSPDGRYYYFRNNVKGVLRFDFQKQEKTLIYAVPTGFVVASSCPVVSPDGRLVAFNIFEQPKPQNPDVKGLKRKLMIMPAEGGPAREVLSIEEPDRISFAGGYAWTPDGRYLLVVHGSMADAFVPEIWRVALDGSAPRKIGVSAPYLLYLAVHPDGKRITFQQGWPNQEVMRLDNFLPPAR
jgi:Tol biopolymer transport system component